MLRRTFGVLYVELAFCLPSSQWNVWFLFLLVWEFTGFEGVDDVGVGDCQNDLLSADLMAVVLLSIVGGLALLEPALFALLV